MPRTPTRLQPADVLRPAALDALKALACPAAALDIADDGDLCTYTVAAVRKVSAMPSIAVDPIRILRIHAAVPPLGEAPFTDAFLSLRNTLAR
ncbi:hypothetical protein [Sphingomonas sp. 2SG]|uniref:hypothetical protein n=1 Tax=Sphingomonas sp. 2SG TaxID=2502201 RepID=UPI0010F872FE|nr:hypothetical protein [Sphingomonas sp. 2SG]